MTTFFVDADANKGSSQGIDDDNDDSDSAITTCISNPGIADRLEQDVTGFSKHGFSFQRHKSSNGGGILSYRPPPTTTSSSTSVLPSSASLTIRVETTSKNVVALLSSIGPWLRTLVRLCVDPLSPQLLRVAVVVVSVDDEVDDRLLKARSVAHGIHMLVRNSMGGALFLNNLTIVLPKNLSKPSVMNWMSRNKDGCYEYPSIRLTEVQSTQTPTLLRPFEIDLGLVTPASSTSSLSVAPPLATMPLSPTTCLRGFDPSRQYLAMTVATRMCTVRLMPVVYHLVNTLLLEQQHSRSIFQEIEPALSQELGHSKIMVVCLEKISNLYRVLMLIRDYTFQGKYLQQQHRLVVVVKDATTATEFQKAANKFLRETNHDLLLLTDVVDVPNAKSVIRRLCRRHDGNKNGATIGAHLVAIDLHPNAISLHDTIAVPILQKATILVWGFESDGIPSCLLHALNDGGDDDDDEFDENSKNNNTIQHVQIPSRTSVNVIAAVSILFHVVFG